MNVRLAFVLISFAVWPSFVVGQGLLTNDSAARVRAEQQAVDSIRESWQSPNIVHRSGVTQALVAQAALACTPPYPLPAAPSAGTYSVTFTASWASQTSDSDSFQGTLWREPCAGTISGTTLYLRIAPTKGYPFICSSAFNVVQGGAQYDILLTQSAGGSSFCQDLLTSTTFIVDQYSFQLPIDRSAAFTLWFNGVWEKYQAFLNAYGTPPEPLTPNAQTLWFVPPASDVGHQGFIRITNPADTAQTVQFFGVDDAGKLSAGTPSFTVSARESKQFNSTDIESGAAGKGLAGALGTGTGNWRLFFTSAGAIKATALIRVPDGFLTSVQDADVNKVQLSTFHVIPTVNPAINPIYVSVLRFINPNFNPVTVSFFAYDDAAQRAPLVGSRSFKIDAFKAVHLTSTELENGAPTKGLSTGLGTGTGKWRITVSSDIPIKVMNLSYSAFGYITELPTESTALQ